MSSSRKIINQKASKSVPRALLKTTGGTAQLTATQTTNTQITNTDSNIYLGRNNDRVVQVGDSTFVVETPKDVYVNNYETINNQQYVSNSMVLAVEGNGTLVTSDARTLNFTGSGVSVTGSGQNVVVNIPGDGVTLSQVGSTLTVDIPAAVTTVPLATPFVVGGIYGCTISSELLRNTIIGYGSGDTANSTGAYDNVIMGYGTGTCINGNPETVDGSRNVIIGSESGKFNTTGQNNVFIGHSSGRDNTIGIGNVFLGSQTGLNNVEGNSNTFIGIYAGNSNIFGNYNTFIGKCAGYSNTVGTSNIYIGRYAGKWATSSDGIHIGKYAGCNSDGSDNIYLGRSAGSGGLYTMNNGNSNIHIGSDAGKYNLTASNNIFIGNAAGISSASGEYNIFLGSGAGSSNSTGTYNHIMGNLAGNYNTTGSNNHFFGKYTGYYNTIGSDNVFIGKSAGYYNSIGSNNIFLGNQAGCGAYGLANITTESNRIILGNTSHTCAQIQVAWTVVSDCRDKHIYCRLDKGRGFLENINPIVFSFKDRETNEITDPRKRYGFSAQEILSLENDDPVIVGTEDPDKLGMTHEYLIPIMINAIKELNIENKALRADVDLLKELLKSTSLPNTLG